FSLLRTIGKGSFGRVILVHHKKLDKFFALKVLNKEKLVRGNQVNHTINERNILYACDHPNIIRFFGSFKDSSYVYFVMKLYCNGDLYSLMKSKKSFDESQARFYAANVFLALEYLHINNVLYRDLKPENVLLSANGYLKLTDFGFAKRVKSNQLTKTMCGTPDYLSPEVLSEIPYSKSVDWWSFGVFVYELNTGKPPFSGSNQKELYAAILRGEFLIPKTFSSNLTNMCKRLIEKKVSKRLGCSTRRQSDEVRDHKWFLNQVDWAALSTQQVVAPFVPKTVDPLDIAFKKPRSAEEPLKIARTDRYHDTFIDF
ncbi:unnamed protein product, partial [Sphagnum balticum]